MLNNLNKNFDVLNDAQKKATFHIDGPLIIIAGAGSGKTRVLTYRIAHLLNTGPLDGDRRYALFDGKGKVFNAKREGLFSLYRLSNTISNSWE